MVSEALDCLHARHVAAEFFTNDLNRVVTDLGVDCNQCLVVDTVVTAHTATDNVSAKACNEVLQEWTRSLVE